MSKSGHLDVPVLFLVFNRPSQTERVFARIRDARPRRLFVAADGPRADRPNERDLTEAARAAATAVDWECEVRTLFRDRNLGCRAAVAEAVTWFFGQVPHGIVLEDDCLPSSSFFPYCEELLARYADEPRIWHITGCNFGAPAGLTAYSYDFCSYPQVWGWASWADRWARYDNTMASWPRIRGHIARRLEWSLAERLNHTTKLDRAYLGDIDTWDYQWHVTVMAAEGLCIAPAANLVTNLGFGSDATHTTNTADRRASLTAGVAEFPLRHPDEISANTALDRHYIATMSGGSAVRSLARLARRDWRHRLAYRSAHRPPKAALASAR